MTPSRSLDDPSDAPAPPSSSRGAPIVRPIGDDDDRRAAPAAPGPRPPFEAPPHERGAAGELRKVGIELEIAGLDLADAAGAVQEVFGGDVDERDVFDWRVVGTDVGDFVVGIDARRLRDGSYLELFDGALDTRDIEEPLEKVVGWLAKQLVPLEIATPPLLLTDLPRADQLARVLAARGARGTGSRLRYALGLHLNPEVPSTDSASILRHLQAFLLLYPEKLLDETSQVDLARRLLPFIAPFSPHYTRLVLALPDAPPLEDLAATYVAHNPTRNRPLDLLPLFTHLLGPEILVDLPEDELIHARPTYHYRLPDCRLDEPTWSIADEWNRWLRVERLAARPDELARRCRQRCAALPSEPPGLLDDIEQGIRQALGLPGRHEQDRES